MDPMTVPQLSLAEFLPLYPMRAPNLTWFRRGLFWMNRRGSELLPPVATLLRQAEAKHVQAAVVEIENFDELMADLIEADAKIDEETRLKVLPKQSHLTSARQAD